MVIALLSLPLSLVLSLPLSLLLSLPLSLVLSSTVTTLSLPLSQGKAEQQNKTKKRKQMQRASFDEEANKLLLDPTTDVEGNAGDEGTGRNTRSSGLWKRAVLVVLACSGLLALVVYCIVLPAAIGYVLQRSTVEFSAVNITHVAHTHYGPQAERNGIKGREEDGTLRLYVAADFDCGIDAFLLMSKWNWGRSRFFRGKVPGINAARAKDPRCKGKKVYAQRNVSKLASSLRGGGLSINLGPRCSSRRRFPGRYVHDKRTLC